MSTEHRTCLEPSPGTASISRTDNVRGVPSHHYHPPSKQSNSLSGRTEGLGVMSSKEKMLRYFKNQVKGKVLQSFQHFKSDSPKISTRMVPDGNVTQPFALHIKNKFFFP